MTGTQTFSATDLAFRSGDVFDAASHAPVMITKYRKPRFVLMSMKRYDMMTNKSSQKSYAIEDMPDELKDLLISELERDLVTDGE